MRRIALILTLSALAACGRAPVDEAPPPAPAAATGPAAMNGLIAEYAAFHEIPASLLHRVVQRESSYNPAARNGPYYGLMQILPETARGMGYEGSPEGLLDAETNLQYAGRYLRGAWLLSNGDEAAAVRRYAAGYYYEARDRCMLVETGLRNREVASRCG